MALKIHYHDESLIVVEKPAGMLVHPGRDPEPDDQIAMKVVRDQIGQRVSPVHRLDRPTSGLLIFGLNSEAATQLRNQFDAREIEKEYSAVVLGRAERSWTCCKPIQKNESEPEREAETIFERVGVCEVGGEFFSFVKAIPKTGRFHQIRKHLAFAGLPIVGDFLYGEIVQMERIAELIDQSRLMLHASRIEFTHPETGERIGVESPLPERFLPFREATGLVH